MLEETEAWHIPDYSELVEIPENILAELEEKFCEGMGYNFYVSPLEFNYYIEVLLS